MVTRHISLDEDHIEKIKPYLRAHHSNFGIALKEIINEATKYSSRKNSSAIDPSLLNWMINEIDGTLVPDSVLDEIFDPSLINSMKKLEEDINRKLDELQWFITFHLICDSDRFPSDVHIEMRGEAQKIKFVGCIISQFFIKNSLEHAPLEIKNIINTGNYVKICMFRSNRKESLKSLCDFFGEMDEIKKVIKGRPALWKDIIKRHLSSNYNMVTLHKNYLEDLFANKIPAGDIMIESLAKKPIQEIPLREMLFLIKKVYENSRIVDRVDIDKDTILVSHSYRTKEASEKLKKSFLELLMANGHHYDAKSAANIIVLTHRPDIGIKMDEVVGKFRESKNRVDQELLMFMTFLEGLREIPDIPMSLTALGRRIGTTLMQEYEKENDIINWDLESFQRALEIIDSRLHRVSEWKLDAGNLLYTVRKCHIAADGNTFDKYVCYTSREVFKGALCYAFGDKAELNINKLLTRGDNLCEVVIRILQAKDPDSTAISC